MSPMRKIQEPLDPALEGMDITSSAPFRLCARITGRWDGMSTESLKGCHSLSRMPDRHAAR